VHLAVHSFTPVWDGVPRPVDIGLLYDPGRASERALAQALERALRARLPALRVRRNQPYRGVSDGLPTALRRTRSPAAYAGLELEVSQALVADAGAWPATCRTLAAAAAEGLMAQVNNSF
jgi:predicted N-formylglutamate amidohydrolase